MFGKKSTNEKILLSKSQYAYDFAKMEKDVASFELASKDLVAKAKKLQNERLNFEISNCQNEIDEYIQDFDKIFKMDIIVLGILPQQDKENYANIVKSELDNVVKLYNANSKLLYDLSAIISNSNQLIARYNADANFCKYHKNSKLYREKYADATVQQRLTMHSNYYAFKNNYNDLYSAVSDVYKQLDIKILAQFATKLKTIIDQLNYLESVAMNLDFQWQGYLQTIFSNDNQYGKIGQIKANLNSIYSCLNILANSPLQTFDYDKVDINAVNIVDKNNK